MLKIGIAIVLIGMLIWLLQWFGYFMRRSWYRHVPKFLIANGAFLPVPLHLWADGLIIFILWILFLEVTDWWRERRQKLKEV